MASGKTHDRVGLISSAVLAGASYIYPATLPVSIGCFVTTWWLSPDVDIPSRPWKRWGRLKGIWTPYQHFTKHRGLSHRIILGTLSRLIYLSFPIVLAIVLLGATNSGTIGFLLTVWQQHNSFILLLLLGLEVGAWLHLWADGMLFGKRKR